MHAQVQLILVNRYFWPDELSDHSICTSKRHSVRNELQVKASRIFKKNPHLFTLASLSVLQSLFWDLWLSWSMNGAQPLAFLETLVQILVSINRWRCSEFWRVGIRHFKENQSLNHGKGKYMLYINLTWTKIQFECANKWKNHSQHKAGGLRSYQGIKCPRNDFQFKYKMGSKLVHLPDACPQPFKYWNRGGKSKSAGINKGYLWLSPGLNLSGDYAIWVYTSRCVLERSGRIYTALWSSVVVLVSANPRRALQKTRGR